MPAPHPIAVVGQQLVNGRPSAPPSVYRTRTAPPAPARRAPVPGRVRRAADRASHAVVWFGYAVRVVAQRHPARP
ncbi:hypothetical protein GCM10027446_20330 [Angustibacter peucedani]